ncbi:MAG: 50S ribosomal protein L29 [Bacteroidales bacterium]|nr:50S ribosomal protein L29 [Bacteroidales bacterium]
MKSSEIREFTDKELEERIETEQSHLTQLRLNHAVSPLDNPNKIKVARKNVARMKTELNTRLKQAKKANQ